MMSWAWRTEPELIPPAWAEAIMAADVQPQRTRPHWALLIGQRVHHRTWGAGRIVALPRAGFARVAFDAGDERTIHQNRLIARPVLRLLRGGRHDAPIPTGSPLPR